MLMSSCPTQKSHFAGELGYKFYTILRGKVRVTQTLLKNRQLQHRPVAILTKGQSFGELALLSDGYRLTSAVSLQPCVFAVLR